MELWAYSFAEQTARTSLVLGLAWCATRAARRRSASTRHALWAAAFIVVMLLPLGSVLLPAWRVALLPAAPVEPVTMSDASLAGAVRMPESVAAENAAQSPVRSAPAPVAPPPTIQRTDTLARPISLTSIVFIWAAIACTIMLRYLLSLAAVAWMKRCAERLLDQRWRDAADVAAATLGLSRPPVLLVSPRINVPFTCGLFRPALVVPSAALDWSDDRIQVVCLHELGHVGRRDCLMQAVTQLVCAIYWFNPLAWIGARRLRAERERACDDLVLEAGTRGSDYAAHLLEIARVAVDVRPRLATAAIAMARPTELEGRLIAILDPRLDRAGARRRVIWQAAAAAALVALPIASVRLVARDVAQSQIQTAWIVSGAATDSSSSSAANLPLKPAASPRVAAARKTAKGDSRRAASDESEKSVAEDEHAAEAVSGSADEETGEAERQLSPAVIEALKGAMKDGDAEVRKTALHALARVRSPATYDVFIAGLKDADPEVRELSAFALSEIRDVRASDALITALRDENPDVREKAAFALGQLRAAQSVPALSAALEDPVDDVREQALFALSQIKDRSAVPALISALSDQNADVRQQAAFGLGQLGDKAAIPSLIAALRDSEAEVREHAAFALSEVGDGTAVEALTAAIKDADPEVRQHAIFAISQIAERGQ